MNTQTQHTRTLHPDHYSRKRLADLIPLSVGRSGVYDEINDKVGNLICFSSIMDPQQSKPVLMDMVNACNSHASLVADNKRLRAFAQEVASHCASPLADCINVEKLGEMARAALNPEVAQ